MPSFSIADLTARQVYKLLVGSIVPRPIAWVSCRSADGRNNIAPFSYFNAVSSRPPMVGFSIEEPKVAGKTVKDTRRLIEETGEFVVNLANADLIDQVVITSVEYDCDIDEFEVAGLSAVTGTTVAAPRIAEAPISFECRLHTAVDLGLSVWMIGEVRHAHVRGDLLADNFDIDIQAYRPLGRLAGARFCTSMNVVPRSVETAGRG